MKIKDVIQQIKQTCAGYGTIDEATTRDQILFGNPDQECKGIVTTCWASTEVLRQAIDLGYNLIICHEALFWNHGDHQDWLLEQGNTIYLKKRRLLEEHKLVVWRNHDYIHSGMRVEGTYSDGIFYGFMQQMHWRKYLINDLRRPTLFQLPPTTAQALADQLIDTLHLNGTKVVGDLDTPVQKVYLCAHIMGQNDHKLITYCEQEAIDLLISFELIDYTVSEYIRDSCMLGRKRAILALGHFNTEEAGMEYLAHVLPSLINAEIPCQFIASGDMYRYTLRKK